MMEVRIVARGLGQTLAARPLLQRYNASKFRVGPTRSLLFFRAMRFTFLTCKAEVVESTGQK